MRTIEGNLLDCKTGILCHQANCQGVMGAGIAKQIKERYPRVYWDYRRAYERGELKLGEAIITILRAEGIAEPEKGSYRGVPSLVCASVLAQNHYKPRGVCHTNMIALASGFKKVKDFRDGIYEASGLYLDIYIPEGIGCGLAGGNWNEVSSRIDMIVDGVIAVRFKC